MQTKKESGLTLVEVLVGIIIIALFIGVFTQFMGVSLSSVFSWGERTKAITSAEEKMERINAIAVQNDGDLSSLKTDPDPEYVAHADRFVYITGKNRQFSLVDTTKVIDGINVNGTAVYIIAFYKNGQAHVEVTSFIESGNSE